MSELPTTLPKRRTTGWLRAVLIILALAGCVICIVLLRLGTPAGGPVKILGTSICSPTDTINCDFVLNSRWAKVGPIPTSILGLAYFALIALWYVIVGVPNFSGRRWHLPVMAIVFAGVCGSLGFLYVLAFELPVWCTWCVAAHVVNLWLLIFTILAWPGRPDAPVDGIAPEPPHPSGARVAAALGCGAIILWCILSTITAVNSRLYGQKLEAQYRKVVNNADYAVWRFQQGSEKEIPLRPDDFAIGPADSPFTVVAFGDFQCPFCRSFRFFAERLVAEFPGRLRIVFKHYPLSVECNRHMTQTTHYYACAAARAAEAARASGTPEQASAYARKLYENAGRLDRNPYEMLAQDVGIDLPRFAAALKAGAGRERIEEDVDLGHELGIEGPPALFLNGRPLLHWYILGDPAMDVDATIALWKRLLSAE